MKDYQPELHFNDEVIKGYRKKENIQEHVINIYKNLEQSGFIKINKIEYIDDESKIPTYTDNDGQSWLQVKESRLNMLKIFFTIDQPSKDGCSHIETSATIFIPKLIDDYLYMIKGNTYYTIYQIVDESTYTTYDGVTLKSILMPIILKRQKTTLEDSDGKIHEGLIYNLNLFKKVLNVLHYYLAEYGMEGTLNMFDPEEHIRIAKSDKSRKNNEYAFKISKTVTVLVDKKAFDSDTKVLRPFVFELADMLQRVNVEKVFNDEFWLGKLGLFTKNTNNKIIKAQTVLKSFKRILDSSTQSILRIDDENKKDTFALVAWMIRNYDELKTKDNFDFRHKRARLTEYIVNDLQKKFSNKTYTLLNSPKTINAMKIKSLSTVSPNELISLMMKCSLLRYQNAVNDMSLFNTALKWSKRGPQSIGESSRKAINDKYRDTDPSQLFILDINTFSNSDPGGRYVMPDIKLTA